MALNPKQVSGNYLSIIGGTLRKNVPEGTQGAIRREYETSDNKKGVKFELEYGSLEGNVVAIRFHESDYGKQVSIGIKDGQTYYVQMPLKSRFAIDLMKKLPNVDIAQKIELKPFDFEDDKGKTVKGVSITQNGEKVKNFFFNEETKKQDLYDFPQPENSGQDFDSDDWQAYFNGVAKFLQNYVTLNIVSKLEQLDPNDEVQREEELPTDELNPEDIPF